MAILNINDYNGEIPEGAYYIGRPSLLGNPFIIGKDGNRAEVIQKYRIWLWEQIRGGNVGVRFLANLEGKDLVCHCTPKACHGDIVQEAIRWAAHQMKLRTR